MTDATTSSSAEAGQAAGVVNVTNAYPQGTSIFEYVSGGFAASLFPFTLLSAPFYLLLALVAPALRFPWWALALIWLPIVISIVVPPIGSTSCLQSWPFKHFNAYFDFSEISEVSDSELENLMSTKHVMFVAQPHGVFTFAGAGAIVSWTRRFWTPEACPTAVATVLTVFPFIKNLMGICGIVDASARNLQHILKTRSTILYPGGIAELFLADEKEELLYIKKRKGFVKLALKTGVAIVPLYMFGNTTTLHVAKNRLLMRLARATHLSLTWIWGILGTCIPFPKKCMVVIGSPMSLPKIDAPDQETIEKYHAQYIGEVQRIFDTYKKYHPDYMNKELHFVE